MSTLQERLREWTYSESTSYMSVPLKHPPVCLESADALDARDAEIERLEFGARNSKEAWDAVSETVVTLQGRIAVLETALREIGNLSDADADHRSTIVRDALDG